MILTQTNPIPQPEWQDSYLHLLYTKISSHDDDVVPKLEPGRKHEGGASSLEEKDNHWRSLGETFPSPQTNKPVISSNAAWLDSVQQASALNSYRDSSPCFLAPFSRFDSSDTNIFEKLRFVRCRHRPFPVQAVSPGLSRLDWSGSSSHITVIRKSKPRKCRGHVFADVDSK